MATKLRKGKNVVRSIARVEEPVEAHEFDGLPGDEDGTLVHPELLPDTMPAKLRRIIRETWEIEHGLRPLVICKTREELHGCVGCDEWEDDDPRWGDDV